MKNKIWMGVGIMIVVILAVILFFALNTNEICMECEQIPEDVAITRIEGYVQTALTQVFYEDEVRGIAIYPSERVILNRGSIGAGFAFSIRNTGNETDSFTYTVSTDDPEMQEKCGISESDANNWVSQNKLGRVQLTAGKIIETPILVFFTIPEDAPLCQIKYKVGVANNAGVYASTSIVLEIIEK